MSQVQLSLEHKTCWLGQVNRTIRYLPAVNASFCIRPCTAVGRRNRNIEIQTSSYSPTYSIDVGGGEKMVHFGGRLDHLEAKTFRPGSAVKAARKRAEGLALTALTKAGTQSTRWSRVDRHNGPVSNRH